MTSAPQMEQDKAAVQSLCMALHAPGSTGKKNEPIRHDMSGRRMLCDMLNAISPESSHAAPKYLIHDGSVDDAVRRAAESGLARDEGGMISLTAAGELAARGAWDAAKGAVREEAAELKELYCSLTGDEALAFFHCDYPERADAAGERAEFERLKLECAISMFTGEKISFGRATEVSGLGYVGLLEEVKRRGIPPFVLDEEAYAHDQETNDMLARQ